MARSTSFKPGKSGNPQTKFEPGNCHRWPPGQSGNPAGKSKRRVAFEESFNEALITHGSPEEAAQLLWQAARAREPWAIQELCRRFAPQAHSFHIQDIQDEQIDYSQFSKEQLRQLDAILQQAGSQPLPPDEGNGST